MRLRIVLLLAVLVAALAIGAAPASAANCNASATQTTYHATPSGNFVFNAILSGCTGVSQVRFIRAGTGWSDFSIYSFFGAPNPPQVDVLTKVPVNGYAATSIYTWCWFAWPAVHSINAQFKWQIKNAAYPYNWGTTPTTVGPRHDIIGC